MEPEDDILDTSSLTFLGDFDQQVSEVLDHIHLKRSEVENLNGLITDLYTVFSPVWKDIEVLPFGSIVTGLGMRTSDVDCYIQLPRWLHPPDSSFVMRARNVLMQHQHLFQNAFAIVHAKVPIVQFCHVPTGVHCDLSFSSPAGVANSKLLAYLLNSDRRALKLAILLKYWSKIHTLTGTNLLSSYSLTLLVIFYLQQINILPSVAELQENIEGRYIDGWNTAFQAVACSNKDDGKSMCELLVGFFEYYNSFEFKSYIVCPYLGEMVDRELFVKVETVPSDFALYKTNVAGKKFKPLRLDGAVCVQDPFEHNRNCSVAVYPKLALRISEKIQEAVSIYESYGERAFLEKLFQRTPDSSPCQKKKKNRPPLRGVQKHKPNQNWRQFKLNSRQNYYYRGRGKRNAFKRGRNY